jgi:hypothetical protein
VVERRLGDDLIHARSKDALEHEPPRYNTSKKLSIT